MSMEAFTAVSCTFSICTFKLTISSEKIIWKQGNYGKPNQTVDKWNPRSVMVLIHRVYFDKSIQLKSGEYMGDSLSVMKKDPVRACTRYDSTGKMR